MFFKNDGAEGPVRAQIPALPLRDIVVFPHMVSQLFVGREKSIAALDEAMAHDKEIFLAAQKSAKTNEPTPDDIYTVGTSVRSCSCSGSLTAPSKFWSRGVSARG